MRTRRSDDATWRKKFGIKLQCLIHIKGISQGQFASELGITEATLSRYIKGVHLPDIYKLKRMSQILDCDVNCLLDVEDWL